MKRLISVLLVAVLLVSLAACKGEEEAATRKRKKIKHKDDVSVQDTLIPEETEAETETEPVVPDETEENSELVDSFEAEGGLHDEIDILEVDKEGYISSYEQLKGSDFFAEKEALDFIINCDLRLIDKYEILIAAYEDNSEEREVFCTELEALRSEFESYLTINDTYLAEFGADSQSVSYDDLKYLENSKDAEITDLLVNRQDGQSYNGQFIKPISGYYVSSEYGWRTLYGEADFHLGIDLAASFGTPVYASANGYVVDTGYDPAYGFYIVIDHNNKATVYAHCSQIFADAGDYVEQGSHIANVGSSGMTGGSHLHFEVRISGETTNPRNYIAF